MKKILSILAIIGLLGVANAAQFTSTFSTNTSESIYRTNDQTSAGTRGNYVNTTVPRQGYIVLLDKDKPADSVLVTGNLIIYGGLDNGAVTLNWIAKDVSGNITSGNITGF